MKNILLLLILSFASISSFARINEKVIKLERALQLADDSSKIEILVDLCWELRNTDPERAINYGKEAIVFADRFKDYEHLAKANGFVGVGYRILGNYSEALDYYFHGLEVAKRYDLLEQEGYAHINIGNLNIYQEYYNNAIENLTKAMIIAKQVENQRMEAYANLNLGRAYLLIHDYDEALRHLNVALDIRKKNGNISGQAVAFKDIGDVYFEKSEFRQALANYQESLKTVDKNTDKDLHATINVKIAQVYLYLNILQKSLSYAEQSLELSKEVGSKLVMKNAYQLLSEIKFRSGDYKAAAEYKDLVLRYSDSLFNQQLSEKIFNYEYRLEKEKRQAEIHMLNKDKQIQELLLHRSKSYTLALSVILLLTIILLVYVLSSSKQRRIQNIKLAEQKDELKKINAMKDKMFLIIGHDLRGPISNLESLIEVLIEENEIQGNSELADIFKVFMDSVHSVYDLLENLLYWANSKRGEIIFTPEEVHLNSIVEENMRLYSGMANEKSIKLTANLDQNYVVTADKNMLKTIFRNLISNAIKYTSDKGYIHISLAQKDNFLQVSVNDNGIGFDECTAKKMFSDEIFFTTSGTKNEVGSGLGLIICKEFAEAHGGKIWAVSQPGKGSNFVFTIPLIS